MNFENDILIVDDEINSLRLLAELLEKEGYPVRLAEKAQTAIDSALAKPPSLILLDVRMPEMDGFEVCQRLKQDERTQHVPIIFVSALEDIESKIKGFEAGAIDFISKPLQEQELLARVRTQLSLYQMQQHLEKLVDERTSELNESKASLNQKVRELQESEERLSLIYDSVTDILFYISVEPDDCFRFLSINHAFLKSTGLTRDQIVGKRIEEVIPETSVQLVLDNYKKTIKENRIVRWQETSVYPSGEKIGDVSIAPVLNEKGICTHLVGSVHDITEQKEAKLNYRTVADFTYNWEYWANMDGTLNYVSPACKRISGYSIQDFIDNPSLFKEIIVPQDHEVWDRHYRDARQELKPREVQFRIQRRDGQVRWIEHFCQPVTDKQGRPRGFRASNQDVTKRKQVEEGLQRSKEFNQSVLMSLPDHIAVLDREGNILAVNDAWTQFARENDAKSMDSVGPGVNYLKVCREASENGDETVAEALDGIRSVLDGSSEYFEMEYPCDSPTVKRWFLMTLSPFKGQKGGVIVAHIDISERKRAEDETAKSEERFRRLMEQSPLDIVIMTPEGRISEVNTAWMRNWDVQTDEAAKVIATYNMRTDRQLEELGLAPLVERAFAGESVVLPPIHYISSRVFEEMGLEGVEARSRWIQLNLYSIKDENGGIAYVVCMYMDITDLKQADIELRGAYEEIETLKNQLEAESAYLQEEIKLEHNFKNIVGQSEALKYVLSRVEQVAPMDSPVLIMGETGTGKELMARALHELSPRGKRALVKVNCAALPRELIESELFGREKGAFTGATSTQPGRFELAKGSTLFLDEIGELPLELQAKLLRVLESGEFERLGDARTRHSDARIVAASNRVLEEEVKKGRFREDLWYRLKVFPITVPPLRDRPEDIPLLVKWFIDQFSKKMGKTANDVSKSVMNQMQKYSWPGNVRELMHIIESAMISAQGRKLHFDLPKDKNAQFNDFKTFEQMERDYILQVLKAENWKIGGDNSAAETLGMHVNTLRGRMKKLGIKKLK